MDEVIVALCARGLSTRGIQEELKRYGAEVSTRRLRPVITSSHTLYFLAHLYHLQPGLGEICSDLPGFGT